MSPDQADHSLSSSDYLASPDGLNHLTPPTRTSEMAPPGPPPSSLHPYPQSPQSPSTFPIMVTGGPRTLSFSCPRAIIHSSKKCEDGATFAYNIYVQWWGKTWQVTKRFREFDHLHSQLLDGGYRALPPRPTKSGWFASKPTDPAAIDARKDELNGYLKALLTRRPDVATSTELLSFLSFPSTNPYCWRWSVPVQPGPLLTCEAAPSVDPKTCEVDMLGGGVIAPDGEMKTLMREMRDNTYFNARPKDQLIVEECKLGVSGMWVSTTQQVMVATLEDSTSFSRLGRLWTVIEPDELGAMVVWFKLLRVTHTAHSNQTSAPQASGAGRGGASEGRGGSGGGDCEVIAEWVKGCYESFACKAHCLLVVERRDGQFGGGDERGERGERDGGRLAYVGLESGVVEVFEVPTHSYWVSNVVSECYNFSHYSPYSPHSPHLPCSFGERGDLGYVGQKLMKMTKIATIQLHSATVMC
eukprot:GHVN01105325.1.p1 GENE.GHVN01105325.1~~GHVN01105325.1.p1  ORF type:complete len:533 (-),score=131.90 GHVN01105325.1:37-1446(-)